MSVQEGRYDWLQELGTDIASADLSVRFAEQPPRHIEELLYTLNVRIEIDDEAATRCCGNAHA